jgi:hypothetical protein
MGCVGGCIVHRIGGRILHNANDQFDVPMCDEEQPHGTITVGLLLLRVAAIDDAQML